jgi:hypothetical protein
VSLENLLRIALLEEHVTNAAQLARLLDAAARSLEDARQNSITNETRLDAAYKSITQLCSAALWGNGYRTSKSKPGHHQTMIQSLVHSIEMDTDQVRLLDVFRVKRHAIDYSGEDVDDSSVQECIAAAENLQREVTDWLRTNRPELLP